MLLYCILINERFSKGNINFIIFGIYKGEFYNNKPKVLGTISFNDENKYTGLWKDGFNEY